MNISVERIFRVGGAMVVGAGLIGVAFLVERDTVSDSLAEVPAAIVARGDVRIMQPALDTDKDHIPDWEEALRGTDPHTRTTLATATPQTASEDPYTPPTTVTGRFAEQFLETIVRSSAGKDMTDDEQAKLINQSIGALAGETRDALYTRADIRIVAQSDLAALRAYGNELSDILVKNSTTNENELVILERAVTQNDPDALKALGPIAQAYQGMVKGLLVLATPSDLAKRHVDLINALSMVHTDIVAMQEVF
ncbi:MAG: hypothetical protein U1A28_01015, partial [Patescibacteria group bacterium]|nr:hypothetical protein [Patescibacteria group bacterium]